MTGPMVARDTLGMPGYVEEPWLAMIRELADRRHLAEAAETTLSLGGLIEQLRAFPAGLPVEFRGCGLDGHVPVVLSSWRGVYADLAIEPGHPDTYQQRTVGELLQLCEDADGTVYEGYKGGEFVMRGSTPVWVDKCGDWTPDRGIVGLRPLMRAGEPVKVRIVLRSWADPDEEQS